MCVPCAAWLVVSLPLLENAKVKVEEAQLSRALLPRLQLRDTMVPALDSPTRRLALTARGGQGQKLAPARVLDLRCALVD